MRMISHVKVSLKTTFIVLDNVCEIAKRNNLYCISYGNFVVLKIKYTYIVFKSDKQGRNHVNIVKIKAPEEIQESVDSFLSIIGCKKHSLTVDNISASISVFKKLDIDEIVNKEKYKQLNHFLSLKYNDQLFPGASIKFSIGTAVVFSSGKINFVGCKTIHNLECLKQSICAII